jgi:hypothetical protein
MQEKTALKNNLAATSSDLGAVNHSPDCKNTNSNRLSVGEKLPLNQVNGIYPASKVINSTELQPVHHFNKMSVFAHSRPLIQAKLSVNEPGDFYEQEADAMADKVMYRQERSSDENDFITGKVEELNRGITPLLQTKGEARGTVTPLLNEAIAASKGSGNSIDSSTASFMSKNFGADFSQVKIHADNEAAEMNTELRARAFTTGNDIYFNHGEYQPSSSKGKHLLAHELTHVVQQTGGNQRIQKDDADVEKAAAAEAKKKTDLITKIKGYGIIAVEDDDANFSSAELELVDKAIAGLPVGDKAAIAGAKIIRVSSLGGKTAGRYSNTQGYDREVTDEQKIELADKAFGGTSAAESIRLITHEIGHAIAAKPYRLAMSEEAKAGAKWNKLVDEANVATDEFNTANDDSNNAIEEFNAASDALTDAKNSGDKDAIAAATKDKAAKKVIMDKLKAERTKKETVSSTKEAAANAQKAVLTAKESTTKTKIANIDDLKTDAATKLTAMEAAYTGASATIDMADPDSADYRASLTAVEKAIKTFYDENVTVDVDDQTAESAKSVVDRAIGDRDSKRDALNKAKPGNAVTGATTALEQAQDSCYKAAIVVAFNKSMNLAVKKFYDFVIKNAISPALTTYAEENWPHKPEEFYAEAYSFFVTKPKDLEAHSKLLYDWFKAGSYK